MLPVSLEVSSPVKLQTTTALARRSVLQTAATTASMSHQTSMHHQTWILGVLSEVSFHDGTLMKTILDLHSSLQSVTKSDPAPDHDVAPSMSSPDSIRDISSSFSYQQSSCERADHRADGIDQDATQLCVQDRKTDTSYTCNDSVQEVRIHSHAEIGFFVSSDAFHVCSNIECESFSSLLTRTCDRFEGAQCRDNCQCSADLSTRKRHLNFPCILDRVPFFFTSHLSYSTRCS